ncbi:hypothetical protein Y032_0071g564 [Ancylostoma ceylanicum]|uniref:Uncharacterized protein n=1 Tax=Ancylostoma ceylanicum TaxID=53326 RepID=A0A016TY38_9BILA|nr:hypothetical protein Y032_0071g564 [Ancylostoma ceylanicum]
MIKRNCVRWWLAKRFWLKLCLEGLFVVLNTNVASILYRNLTAGIHSDGLSAASKSTRRDCVARAEILCGTTNYGVFLIVS